MCFLLATIKPNLAFRPHLLSLQKLRIHVSEECVKYCTKLSFFFPSFLKLYKSYQWKVNCHKRKNDKSKPLRTENEERIMKENVITSSFIPSAAPKDERELPACWTFLYLMTAWNTHEARMTAAYTVSCKADFSYTSYFWSHYNMTLKWI